MADHGTTSLRDTDLASHFAFGENWRAFVGKVDDARVTEATKSLARLIPPEDIQGKRFLDIGCGSGLSMLAAMRLGAAEVLGIDLDPSSIKAAETLLSRWAPGGPWRTELGSALALDRLAPTQFDIVHSWGVLQCTGAQWQGMEGCAARVRPGGLLVLALYRRTPLCGAWTIEKRFYAHAPAWVQSCLRGAYASAFAAGLLAKGRNPRRHLANYVGRRGMDWWHDVEDWLGGYPYDSTDPDEVAARLAPLGFTMERVFPVHPPLAGLFGSGCDEYVARRSS